MNMSKEEMAIMEHALMAVSQKSSDNQEIIQIEALLNKLKNSGINANAQLDGFRYDYDDNM